MSETKSKRAVVEEVKNGTRFSDGTILIKDVRASYPHVFTPYVGKPDKDGKQGKPAFSITVMLPKRTHVAVKNMLQRECEKLLKEEKIAKLAPAKWFLRNGDDSDSVDYEGHWTVSCREQPARPPAIRDWDKTKLTKADEGRIYGGCYVNILCRPWWQDNTFGRRLNAGLSAVQFIRDGEAFGKGRLSDDDIEETFDDEGTSGVEEDEFAGL